MDIAQASTALHQSRVQTEAGFRVQSMAQDHAEVQAEGLNRLLEGASVLQPTDAGHLGNLIDVQA
ncbi:MAG: putative motility protein [Spirochaeta sp.]